MPKTKKKKFQANQYQVDPRQTTFLTLYLDPKSETYSNALQSGIEAGYEKEYAENILSLMPDWLSESMGKRNRMLVKAENNLEELLGEEEDKRIKLDTTKFVAERLGKEHYASSKEGNVVVQVNIANILDKYGKQ